MQLIRFIVLTLIVLSVYSQNVSAQAEKRLIREGNRLYQKEQFDESELSYRRALEKDEDSPRARFNLGNALFKQERYDEAIRFFGELADDVEDPVNLSKVYHNLGNSMLMTQQIEQSIEAYKEALRNNPGDAETRYNLAYAQHLLDEMEDQQQDQNEDGDNDQDDNQDDNQGDNQGDDEGQDDNQEQQDSGDNDQENGDDSQPEDQQQENQQNNQSQPDQISAEDALRMLQAAEREEQKVQEKLNESKTSGQQTRSGRNW